MINVLIVHHDNEFLSLLKSLIETEHNILSANSNSAAREVLSKYPISISIVDMSMESADSIDLIDEINDKNPVASIICLSDYYCVDECLACAERNVDDYIVRPVDISFILSSIDRVVNNLNLRSEVNYLKKELESFLSDSHIQSRSSVMKDLLRTVRQIAPTNSSILITGESGVGKELIAREIFLKSTRFKKPFVTVNCGAIPSELIESELFGHEKGAFTGATERKLGKFEVADGGTIFLDEISTLPHNLQVKLLRVLQERTFEPVGSVKTLNVDIRIIAASNDDLLKLVSEGKFRQDLYYRLNVVPLLVMPLRDRKEDIGVLAVYFLEKYSRINNKPIGAIEPEVLKALENYSWPGNVRELENLIERLVVLADPKAHIITTFDLPMDILFDTSSTMAIAGSDYKNAMAAFEKRLIFTALHKNAWHKAKTAKFLKIHRNTLNLKIKQLNIKRP